MKKIKLEQKLLIYDIETAVLNVNLFRLGEQVIKHHQLTPSASMHKILTISYKWYDKNEIITLTGDDLITKFDEQVKKADIIIGKNNARFDNKYINTARMLQELDPLPEWAFLSDDVEKQLRKYFVFPSYSLDYVSKLFGLGGKEKMEFQDWVDIYNVDLLREFESLISKILLGKLIKPFMLNCFCLVLFKSLQRKIKKEGNKAWKKMIHYNKKDVLDTENCLIRIMPYIQLKFNAAANKGDLACILCGYSGIIPTKIITQGKTNYQLFHCPSHNGYAGKATYCWDKNRHKKFGKIG